MCLKSRSAFHKVVGIKSERLPIQLSLFTCIYKMRGSGERGVGGGKYQRRRWGGGIRSPVLATVPNGLCSMLEMRRALEAELMYGLFRCCFLSCKQEKERWVSMAPFCVGWRWARNEDDKIHIPKVNWNNCGKLGVILVLSFSLHLHVAWDCCSTSRGTCPPPSEA